MLAWAQGGWGRRRHPGMGEAVGVAEIPPPAVVKAAADAGSSVRPHAFPVCIHQAVAAAGVGPPLWDGAAALVPRRLLLGGRMRMRV